MLFPNGCWLLFQNHQRSGHCADIASCTGDSSGSYGGARNSGNDGDTCTRDEHLDDYLEADWIDLPTDVLNRIDEIVPPGVTTHVTDNMWESGTTALTTASRRR